MRFLDQVQDLDRILIKSIWQYSNDKTCYNNEETESVKKRWETLKGSF